MVNGLADSQVDMFACIALGPNKTGACINKCVNNWGYHFRTLIAPNNLTMKTFNIGH